MLCLCFDCGNYVLSHFIETREEEEEGKKMSGNRAIYSNELGEMLKPQLHELYVNQRQQVTVLLGGYVDQRMA